MEFSPIMVFSAMGWLGIGAVPVLIITVVPISWISERLNKRWLSLILTASVLLASAWAIHAAQSAGVYTDMFYRIMGATGLVWAALALTRILKRRST